MSGDRDAGQSPSRRGQSPIRGSTRDAGKQRQQMHMQQQQQQQQQQQHHQQQHQQQQQQQQHEPIERRTSLGQVPIRRGQILHEQAFVTTRDDAGQSDDHVEKEIRGLNKQLLGQQNCILELEEKITQSRREIMSHMDIQFRELDERLSHNTQRIHEAFARTFMERVEHQFVTNQDMNDLKKKMHELERKLSSSTATKDIYHFEQRILELERNFSHSAIQTMMRSLFEQEIERRFISAEQNARQQISYLEDRLTVVEGSLSGVHIHGHPGGYEQANTLANILGRFEGKVKCLEDASVTIIHSIETLQYSVTVKEPGPPGPAGPPGPEGPMGQQGLQGEPGVQGERGHTGKRGFPGPPGPEGPSGESGPQGRVGERGFPGEQGMRGLQGPRGEKGEQSERGEPGPQGYQGEQGTQGLQGVQGVRGERGPKGDMGPEGPEGKPGLLGMAGPRGPEGKMGPPGPAGSQGQGVPGPAGSQGVQGRSGVPGPLGIIGPQGMHGQEGPRGRVGPVGESGERGPLGATADLQDALIHYKIDTSVCSGTCKVVHSDLQPPALPGPPSSTRSARPTGFVSTPQDSDILPPAISPSNTGLPRTVSPASPTGQLQGQSLQFARPG